MEHVSHVDDFRSANELRYNQWPPQADFSGRNPPNIGYILIRDFFSKLADKIFSIKQINHEIIDKIDAQNTGVIFASNHDSGLDPFYFARHFRGRIHTLAVDNPLLDNDLFRGVFSIIGTIPVAARGNKSTMETAYQLLRHDFSVLVYPEANFIHKYRNIFGHSGLAVLSAMSGKPILSFGINGIDYRHFLLFSPPFNRKISVKYNIPRFVREEYRISGSETLNPEVVRGITDEIMYDIRRASNYCGLTHEHAKKVFTYFKNFKTDQYTYQDPEFL